MIIYLHEKSNEKETCSPIMQELFMYIEILNKYCLEILLVFVIYVMFMTALIITIVVVAITMIHVMIVII